jgi:hypothetical protein
VVHAPVAFRHVASDLHFVRHCQRLHATSHGNLEACMSPHKCPMSAMPTLQSLPGWHNLCILTHSQCWQSMTSRLASFGPTSASRLECQQLKNLSTQEFITGAFLAPMVAQACGRPPTSISVWHVQREVENMRQPRVRSEARQADCLASALQITLVILIIAG